MISLSKITDKIGAGRWLVPFFKSVMVYFVVAGADEVPSLTVVLFKCAPVLSLALFVTIYCGSPSRSQATKRRGARLRAGLLLSALGDALLVWEAWLAAGMAAFAAAHVCYARAFGWRPPRWRLLPPLLLPAPALLLLRPPPALAPLVAAYALLLALAAWRALAATDGSPGAGAGAAGALLFVLSDSLLACHLFYAPLRHERALVMSTYYLAQLGIALSVLPKRAR